MRSLAKASLSGFAYLIGQSGAARIVGFVSQIFMARLLHPSDFGDIAIASSVAGVLGALVGFGVEDVLLSRSHRFRLWAAPAFWISLALSLVGAMTLLAAAPIAARVYRSSTLFGLLLVLASSMPLGALATIPSAYLRSNLEFRFLATYATAELLAIQLTTILLAWRGFGAFSFVIPTPIAATVRSIILWRVARPSITWRLRQRQVGPLLRSCSAVFGTKLLTSLRQNGDYMLLGIFASKSSVGLYFMAFRLAAAPVYTLASSMFGVLFPALSHLRGEPDRQRGAVLSASRVIALVVIPLSFLQAAVSGHLIHLFFGPKWAGAAPMLSILSIGLAFDVVPCVAAAVVTANGRFAALWNWSIASLPVFFILIAVGCAEHRAEGVAVGVTTFFMMAGPNFSYFAMKPFGCSVRDIAGIYLPPTICASTAVGAGVLMSRLPQVQGREIGQTLIICVFALAGYCLLLSWLSPPTTKESVRRLSLILSPTR